MGTHPHSSPSNYSVFNPTAFQDLVKPFLQATFTEAEVALVLQQPNRRTFTGFRDYVILLLLLDTGIRLGELSALHVSDHDLSDQLLHIFKGKGSKSRFVSIQDYRFKHLCSYLQLRGKQFHENLWIIRNGQPLQRASIIEMLQKHCRRAGFQGSAHTFRRTMAKIFLLSGGNVHALQTILGHSTLEMTRQYVHLLPSDLHSRHETYSPVESLLAYHSQMREERSPFHE